jgi:polysaccharide export outer membrane protein
VHGFLLALAILGGIAETPVTTNAASVPAVQAAPPVPSAAQDPGPSSDPYRIHAGDQLAVEVFGDASLSHTVTVLSGGDVFYPLVGRIHLDGLTPDQAAATVGIALRKYVRQPIVTISVISQGPIDVLVLGDVKNPGKYLMPATSRVSDALAAAGGLGPSDGDFPVARVQSTAGATTQVSLQKLLHDGDTTVDMRLANGTTLYVPSPATFTVEVLGSVDRPGEIMLHEGDKLAMAIAKAGAGPTTNPDFNNIQVKRTLPDGTTKTYSVNLYETFKNGNVSQDLTMSKGDIVFVPQAKKPFMSGGIGGFLSSLLFLVK